MFRTTPLLIAVALSCAAAGAISFQHHQLAQERARTSAAALQTLNTAAAQDSTRIVAATNVRMSSLLGDSLRLVERRAVQIKQRGDALDGALGDERRAKVLLSATVDSLQGLVASGGSLADEGGIRSASFNLRQAPYSVQATVDMPPPPDSARLAVRIAVDPIHFDERIECGPPNEFGARAAMVTASSPPWANVRLDHVEQSPELCQTPIANSTGRSHRSLRFTPLVVGAGRVLGRNGTAAWGVFVGAGVQLFSGEA